MTNEFNFTGPVNGPVQAGSGNTQNNYPGVTGQVTAETVRQAVLLVEQLRAEAPQAVPQAEEVHGELVRADQNSTPANRGRIMHLLGVITTAVGAGSGALALVEAIRQAIGG